MDQEEAWAKELKKSKRFETLDLEREFGFSERMNFTERNEALKQLKHGIAQHDARETQQGVLRLVRIRCEQARQKIEQQPSPQRKKEIRAVELKKVYTDITALLATVTFLSQQP